MSRELILGMTMSLDGLIAGPNGEMDWVFPSMSPEGQGWLTEQLWQTGLIAMGHRSYHAMADFWPTANNPVAGPMNEISKVIFSRSGAITAPNLEKSLAALPEGDRALESWRNPLVAGTDLVADVQRLKAEEGQPIVAIAGVEFAASLIAAGLVDVFRLSVHPVALGRGKGLFEGLESPLRLKLEDVKGFASGVVVKTYRPA